MNNKDRRLIYHTMLSFISEASNDSTKEKIFYDGHEVYKESIPLLLAIYEQLSQMGLLSYEDYKQYSSEEKIFEVLKRYDFQAEEKVVKDLIDNFSYSNISLGHNINKAVIKLNNHFIVTFWMQGAKNQYNTQMFEGYFGKGLLGEDELFFKENENWTNGGNDGC